MKMLRNAMTARAYSLLGGGSIIVGYVVCIIYILHLPAYLNLSYEAKYFALVAPQTSSKVQGLDMKGCFECATSAWTNYIMMMMMTMTDAP